MSARFYESIPLADDVVPLLSLQLAPTISQQLLRMLDCTRGADGGYTLDACVRAQQRCVRR